MYAKKLKWVPYSLFKPKGTEGMAVKLSKMIHVIKAHSAESMVTSNVSHTSKAHSADSTLLCMIMVIMIRKCQRYAPWFPFWPGALP